MKAIVCALAAALLLTACYDRVRPESTSMPPPLEYPATERGARTDDYFGTQVADPYRWMETLGADATRNWVTAQNALAQPYLEALPARNWIKNRLTQVWNYERYGIPVVEGGRYFYLRNDGLQNQSVLYVAESLDAAPRVLLDPNTLAKDATVALADWTPSPDGRFVAYALSDGGTDWKIWRIRDVATGKDLGDDLRYAKFTDVSWERDSSAFYYSRYPLLPAADGAPARGDDSKQSILYRHRVGTPQTDDTLIYAITDHPTRTPYATVSEDGRYLIIRLFDGYEANAILYRELKEPAAAVRPLIGGWSGLHQFVGSQGDEVFFLTTDQAPRGRIVAVNVNKPERSSWREIVPQAAEPLDDARYIGGRFVALYLKDAHAAVSVYEATGKKAHDVTLPGLGRVTGFFGSADKAETFFSYTDYLTPAAVYRYNVSTNKTDVFRKPKVDIDASPYVTRQVFIESTGGTRLPLFITHRKDLKLDGKAPTLLYGYGGFNSSVTPAFSTSIFVWLEMGGVHVTANLRGGGEYGEAWHRAGTKLNKQNVFDDFIAAARWLQAERYTSRDRLAIYGRSNGGLLVGATMTQHPELFAAALPAVGVLDMLRYHTASANARQWSSDYGLSENAEEFKALYAYSPYHRALNDQTKPGVCYPPTLVTTADRDDRVVPWNSYKFGAALQQAQKCANPVLVRVETRAGHGAGKPVWMQIDDIADQWSFVAHHLRMQIPAK